MYFEFKSPITINSTGPGALTLRIGSLGGSSFFADSNGAINLQHVNFNIGGSLIAEAGTVIGGVTLGNVTARDLIRVTSGSSQGNITVGALNVTSVTGLASIDLFASNVTPGTQGIITINGPIVATTSAPGADARVNINGRVVTINGNTTVTAGVNGSASFDVSARNGVTINGGVTLSGVDGENSLDIFNNGTGNIFVSGALRILNGSYSSVSVSNNGGDVRLNGLVEVIGEEAEINISGGRITLGAGARATANTSNGSAAR